MSPELVLDTPQALARALVEDFEATCREALSARGLFTCALTGGSSARALYPALAAARVDWSRIHLFFGDERCVPPEHADSNYRLARETLLGQLPVAAEQVHRIRGELSPGEAAARYERELQGLLGPAPVLDAVHLGMGEDGHICSLFPGHPAFAAASLDTGRFVVAVDGAPKPPPQRVSFSLRTVAAARALRFLVMGAPKAEAVRAALRDPSSGLPAAIAHRTVTERSGSSRWFLDSAAARLL